MSKHVVVLMGGWSAERDISLVTGAAVADALEEAGYRVARVEVSRDVGELLDALQPRPDVVFNALHGRFGEDGCVQGLLEFLGIPYTHSGPLASALAMNKPVAKRLFQQAGIRCPEGVVVSRRELKRGAPMEPPFVVKPTNEGSSVGVQIVGKGDNRLICLDGDWPYGEEVLVERYIPGREITVAVMGNRVLGATELRPTEGFYDYTAKYTEGRTEHLVPAPLDPRAYEEVLGLAQLGHRILGCRGVTRADLRYDDTKDETGRFYMLEVNTQPGMTPLSLVPELAAHAGIGFTELVTWMLEEARCDG